MTIANKITIGRILMIPLMIIFVIIPSLNKPEDTIIFGMTIGQLIFTILFILASLTDFLDGYLARSRDEITTFGKFLDPIADKILVLTALIFMTKFPYWIDGNQDRYSIYILIGILVIIIREFVITGIRLIAADKGIVIAASPLGKAKTFATMIAIIVMLFNGFGLMNLIKEGLFDYISMGIFWVAIILTLLSGVDYIIRNRAIILESV
ncbi:MAG TPA: CDP-diacylglycerol--glycerol-3-phosphate 3-phosphatidyltransferase [Acholeplasmataceae bacterium]|jgi:CDP-diacylglycerol--glycerol-3-phosphate 3-phosphatidyltransferase|nr:CDP-diacylglycerol--glycerol-3-phosphate 3-phosphatidyltransferase [Acholeplasmataceae bacterium]